MDQEQASSAAPGLGPGAVVDQQAGEVPVSADDRQVIELKQGGGLPNLLLYVRPVKRRHSVQIRKWLAFMRDEVNRANAAVYQEQVFRCADEFAEILKAHLEGWENAGKPFDLRLFDDVLDDGQVMIAVAELYALSVAGSMAKKPLGSPLRLSTQDAAGSNPETGDGPTSGPLSTRSALDASTAKESTPDGSVGSIGPVGTLPPSSSQKETTNAPPPPLPTASG